MADSPVVGVGGPAQALMMVMRKRPSIGSQAGRQAGQRTTYGASVVLGIYRHSIKAGVYVEY